MPWAKVTWRRVDDPLGVFRGRGRWPHSIHRFATGGPGLVALGRGEGPVPDAASDVALIWTSPDGTFWDRQPLTAGVPRGNTAEAFLIAAGPQGIVLIGDVCCEPEERAAWHSPDAFAWNRAGWVGGMGDNAMDVAAGPNGFVAVGAESAQQEMAIWFSPDGLRWERVGPDGHLGQLNGVVWSADAYIAAGRESVGPDYDAVVFRSHDGREWSRVAAADPTIVGPDDTEIDRLVGFAGGIFAAGRRNPVAERKECEDLLGSGLASVGGTALSCGWGRTTLWVSPDARAWRGGRPVDPPVGRPMPAGRPVGYYMVEQGGPGLVNLALGDQGPPLWISGDGLEWSDVPIHEPPLPADVSLSDMIVIGRRIVAVGDEWDPDQPDEVGHGVVWIGDARPF